jgi:hypothetical protein
MQGMLERSHMLCSDEGTRESCSTPWHEAASVNGQRDAIEAKLRALDFFRAQGLPVTDLVELERRLWAAADTLCANSSLTPAEYRGPVLGLIFLAFAEHRFDELRPERELKATWSATAQADTTAILTASASSPRRAGGAPPSRGERLHRPSRSRRTRRASERAIVRQASEAPFAESTATAILDPSRLGRVSGGA